MIVCALFLGRYSTVFFNNVISFVECLKLVFPTDMFPESQLYRSDVNWIHVLFLHGYLSDLTIFQEPLQVELLLKLSRNHSF